MTPSTEPTALTAAWKPLSSAFLSAKAKAQLRDSKGRFIKMNSLVRWQNASGDGFNHGRVTGTPTGASKSVQVQQDNGQTVNLKSKQLEVVKAILPEPGAPTPAAKNDNVGVNYSAKPKTVDVPDVDEPDSDLYLDSDGFQKVGNQAGSNAGGFYQDPDTGEQYYIKRADDEEHALNEVLASRLYREAGIQVPDVFVSDMADEPAVASKVVADVQQLFNGKPKSNESDKVAKAADGFAVDAWLANWDVVGLTYDNLLQTPDGEPIRIDTGGSLLYRAQGAPKGNLFGNEVGEVDTFRDPNMNPQSYAVFGQVTDEQIAESVRAHVLPVTPERIDALVDSLPTDDEAFKQGLKDKLKARRANLLERFNVSEESTDDGANDTDGADGPGAGEEAPAGAPDLDGGPGDGDATQQDGVDAPPTVATLAEASADEKAAVKWYTSPSYDLLNNFLRKGVFPGANSDFYDNKVEVLDGLLAKSEIETDGVVYRGAARASDFLGAEPLEPGTVISDKAYMSTSLDPDTAMAFTNNNDGVLFEIEVPKGTPVIDAKATSSTYLNEDEYVFGRNSSLEVISDGPNDLGERVIRARLLNAAAAPAPETADVVDVPEGAEQGTYLNEEINAFSAELDKLGALTPTLAQEIDLFSSQQTLDRMNELEEVLREQITDLPNTQRASVLELFDEFRGGPVGEGWPFDDGNFGAPDVVTSDPASLPDDVETPDATPVPSTGGEAVDLVPQVAGKKIYSVPVQHDGPQHVQVGAQVVSVKGDLTGTVVKINAVDGYALVDNGEGKQLWRQWGTLTPPGTGVEAPESASDGSVTALAPQVPGKKIYSLPVQHNGPAHAQPGAKVVSSKDGLKGTITKVNAVDGYALVDNGEGNAYWRQWNTLNLDAAAQTEADTAPALNVPDQPLAPAELEQLTPDSAPLPPGVPEHVAIGKYVVSKKDGFAGVVLKHNLKVDEALVQRADGKKLWRRYKTLAPLPDPEPELTNDEQAVLDALATPDVTPEVNTAPGDVDFGLPSQQLDADIEMFAVDLDNSGLYNTNIDNALDEVGKDPNSSTIADLDAVIEETANALGPISAGKLRAKWADFKSEHDWNDIVEDPNGPSTPVDGLEPLADWEKELLGLIPSAVADPPAPKVADYPVNLPTTIIDPNAANTERDQLVEVLQDLGIGTYIENYLDDYYADPSTSTRSALQNYIDEEVQDAPLADEPIIRGALDAFLKASVTELPATEEHSFANALNVGGFNLDQDSAESIQDDLQSLQKEVNLSTLESLDETLDTVATGLEPAKAQELLGLWDDLKQSKGWQVDLPSEPIAALEPETVLEDASKLNGTPVSGSPHLLEDAQGRYAVNKHGAVLRKGTQVVSSSDGYAGEIIYLEKQKLYAKVQDASGQVKLRQLDTLVPQGVKATETDPPAPAAEPLETNGKKVASALSPGDVVLTPMGEQMTVTKVEDNVFYDDSVLVTYEGFESYPVELLKTDEMTLAVPNEIVTPGVPLMQQKLKKYDGLKTGELEAGMKVGSDYSTALEITDVQLKPDGQVALKINHGPALSFAASEPFYGVWAGDPNFSESDAVAPSAVPQGSKLAEYLKPGDLVLTNSGAWKTVTSVSEDPYAPGEQVLVEFLDTPVAQKYPADTKLSYQEGSLPNAWPIEDLPEGAKVYYKGKLQTVKSIAQDSDGDYMVYFEGVPYSELLYPGSELYGESFADQLNQSLPKPELMPGQTKDVYLPSGQHVSLPAGSSIKKFDNGYIVVDAFNVRYTLGNDGKLTPMQGNMYSTYYGYTEPTDLVNENPVGPLEFNLEGVLALQPNAAKNLTKSFGYQSSSLARQALTRLYEGDFKGDSLDEDEWAALAKSPVSYGNSGDDALDHAIRAEVMKLVKSKTGSYSGEWKKVSYYNLGQSFTLTAPQRKAVSATGLDPADVEVLNSKSYSPPDFPQATARLNAVLSDPTRAKIIDELFGVQTAAQMRSTIQGPGYVSGLSGPLSQYAPNPPALPGAKVSDGTTASLGDYVSAIKDNDSGRVVLVTPDGKFRVQRSDGTTFTRKANGFKRIVAEQSTSIAPAKAVFLKSRADYAEPTWAAPLTGTSAPAEALAKIRTDVPSGVRGASIAVDDDQIEDLNVAMSRLLGKNGEELIELKFKLTPDAGKAWKKRVELEGWNKGNMQVNSRHQLSLDELPVLGNEFTNSHGKTFKKQTERGAEIRFHSADNESVGSQSPLSMHNLVQVYLPADATDADIQRALYDAGVDRPELATPETSKKFVENRMLALLGGYSNPFKKPAGDERAQKLAAIEKEWGFTADDVRFVNGSQGRVELRIPEAAVDKMVDDTKKKGGPYGGGHKTVKYLQHDVKGHDNTLIAMASGPHKALLGAVERKTEGIVDNNGYDATGQSPEEDVRYGSGQYIYTSPVGELSGSGQMIFDPRQMLRKFSFWANKGDNFGKRNGGDRPLDNFYVGAHELMVKYSLDLDEAMGYSVNSQDKKDQLIQRLKDAGVTQLGGKSLEDFIVIVDNYNPSAAEITPAAGLPADQAVPAVSGVSL